MKAGAGRKTATPKSVTTAREELAKEGKELTGENLKTTLDKKSWDALTSAFRSTLSTSQKENYASLKTDQERADMVSQFVMDPQEFKARGCNKVEVFNQQQNKKTGAWLTMAQIGGPQYLNDPAQARTLCESGDLGPSKPNPHPSLSAFPVWYLTMEMAEKLTGTVDSASVKMDTSLTKEEYQQVAESMRGAASSQPKKKAKKAPTPQQPESPEQKELKEAATARTNQLKKLKVTYERVRKECGDASRQVPQIVERGYPQTFVDHLSEKVLAVSELATGATSLYAEQIILELTTKQDVDASTEQLTNKIEFLEGKLNEARRNLWPDIRRLSSKN